MFELNRDSIEINKGKVTKLIVNFDDNTVNIEYQTGYMKDDEFHSMGMEILFIQDIPDEEIFDFTNFYAELNGNDDPLNICFNVLIAKGIAKE